MVPEIKANRRRHNHTTVESNYKYLRQYDYKVYDVKASKSTVGYADRVQFAMTLN